MTQLADEVISDVIDWSNEAGDFRLAHHSLAELCPVLVPLAALPATVTHTGSLVNKLPSSTRGDFHDYVNTCRFISTNRFIWLEFSGFRNLTQSSALSQLTITIRAK